MPFTHPEIYEIYLFEEETNTENIFIRVDDVSLENTFNAPSTAHEHKFVLFMRFCLCFLFFFEHYYNNMKIFSIGCKEEKRTYNLLLTQNDSS